MTAICRGVRSRSMSTDEKGYRTYKVAYNVQCDKSEGPYLASKATGLPAVGTVYDLDLMTGTGTSTSTSGGSLYGAGEIDKYAYCHQDTEVEEHPDHKTGGPCEWYVVTKTFSTAPMPDCTQTETGNPLLQPATYGGSFVRYMMEAKYDRFNDPIVNSAHEFFRGPQVEFPECNATVWMEKNYSSLNLSLVTQMMNCLNDRVLWGMPRRHIQLTQASWTKNYYARCSVYYTWRFEWEVRFDRVALGEASTGFDRDLLDEGTKVLRGHWDTNATSDTYGKWVTDKIGGRDPDPENPTHFIQYKDWNGENTRVLLNGAGKPAILSYIVGTGTSTGTATGTSPLREYPGRIHVEKHPEVNFLLLGVPAAF